MYINNIIIFLKNFIIYIKYKEKQLYKGKIKY